MNWQGWDNDFVPHRHCLGRFPGPFSRGWDARPGGPGLALGVGSGCAGLPAAIKKIRWETFLEVDIGIHRPSSTLCEDLVTAQELLAVDQRQAFRGRLLLRAQRRYHGTVGGRLQERVDNCAITGLRYVQDPSNRCMLTVVPGSAGIAELAIFHPVDTIAKRLMKNEGKITPSQLNSVIFKQYAQASIGKKFTSLFPGLGYAAGYKILQRIYKYGGQPFARDFLAKNYGDSFDRTFGKGNGRAVMSATAGRCATYRFLC